MPKPSANGVLDKFMGMPLGDAEGSESESEPSSSSNDGEQEPKVARKKVTLSVEDLERAGYKSGPSVLYVKPPSEPEQQNWNWSKGRGAKEGEESDDDEEDRAATREAVTTAVEDSAMHSLKAMEHAARLREESKQERLEAKQERWAKEKGASFNQKEKRKRDAGQASRGKNYVEESKRQARAFGVYSGFD